ncbi:MAG: hypothetical protein ACR2RV_00975 [Verrucomicrobiales bacterium]
MFRTPKCLAGLLLVGGMMAGAGRVAGKGDEKALDLDPLLGGAGVWEMSDEEFAKDYIKENAFASFEWVSSSKSSARLQHLSQWRTTSPDGTSNRLTPTIGQGEHEVGEVIVRFKDHRMNRVEISIYNRGDDGESTQEIYKSQLEAITAFLDENLSVRREARKASGKTKTHGLLWKTAQSYYLLEYSYTKPDRSTNFQFRPEFIILKVAPPPAGGGLAVPERRMKTRGDLEEEVVREENGDVVIKTVPMVDQGQKGYCAVASAERVMRYYGVDVNQHEMAQISNTSWGGTSGKVMSKALGQAAGKYHTRVLTLFEFEDIEEMEAVARSYNQLAKKRDKPEFDLKNYYIPISQLLTEGDPKLLKEVRASGTKYSRFQSKLYSYIDDGVPVLWALYLGVFKEEGLPQSGGGHMRIIIGYNKLTQELIYTDSWGAGHEMKRMKMDEAYTMTMQLTILQPAR